MILNSTGHMTAYGVGDFHSHCFILLHGAALRSSIEHRQEKRKYKEIPGYLITLSIRLIIAFVHHVLCFWH
jgi:hypothetical protein